MHSIYYYARGSRKMTNRRAVDEEKYADVRVNVITFASSRLLDQTSVRILQNVASIGQRDIRFKCYFTSPIAGGK